MPTDAATTEAERKRKLRVALDVEVAHIIRWDGDRPLQLHDRIVDLVMNAADEQYRRGLADAAREVEALGGDNAQFHADGIRRRLGGVT